MCCFAFWRAQEALIVTQHLPWATLPVGVGKLHCLHQGALVHNFGPIWSIEPNKETENRSAIWNIDPNTRVAQLEPRDLGHKL